MAAGRLIVLSVVGLELPFVLPFDAPALAAALLVDATVFFPSTSPLLGFVVPFFPAPSCLSFSADSVSTAVSGMISSTIALFLRALNSSAIDSFLCATTPDSSCSSVLKLSRRFDKLGSPLSSLLGWLPSWSPTWPLFSTITKLVLILERGRGDVLSLEAPRKVSR
jgi:hypothetical protein